MSDGRAKGPTAWIVLALVLSVVATYAEVGGFGFLRYDDPDYVLENPAVRGGLSWAGLRWAFTETHASNWHPLTWLAHMLDVSLFDLAPGGHHWASVAWHALAAVLCFLALRALTERTWTSALAAGLFALHPLRVESVAWISERKDVLAGVFFFATLWAHARFARAPGLRRRLLVAFLFALGLAAKPMLVTVPFVLLLLDVWPLARWERGRGWRGALPLLLEKLPLFLLAGLSALVTLHAQRAGGSLYTLEVLPLGARLANAPLAVLGYLRRFLWPAGLAYFYPHPFLVGQASTVAAALALAGVLALGGLALAGARRFPALGVGALWFLGMLVPVLGLVQVGEQALADRYSYLPSVGLSLALLFPLAELAERRASLRPAFGAVGVLVLLACGFASARQARAWRDSETLFARALDVTERNYPAWVGLANERAARGDVAGAREGYEAALAISPSYAPALYSYGLLEQEHGDAARAVELYRRAVASLPGLAAAELNLGSLLAARGDGVEAAQAFERVLELEPTHPDAHYDLALLLLAHGRIDEAREHLDAALAARPDFAAAWEQLGELAEAKGDHVAAIAALEHALRDPTRIEALRWLAWILATAAEPELRDPARALELARRAAQATQRQDPRVLEALAAALAASGDMERAVAVQQEALALLAPSQQGAAHERLARYRGGEAFVHVH